ncbi:MAG: sigma-70 family RNA polymerase sigma factor [Rikenellaceae bacterium]|jgi:RNA polymerase sigma-70 factor (ECF subfamily)|nr:sigma-70 family RNA polymerase sigma factor [Rikenellaceae bacterium]MBO5759327.1 sigma-70 family RNA polymerase sigma factor [Rikenellaceae bacterium]MBO7169235.1 sigma-70 family RNA polymerase sigma factor [Rikenellaceae bacterium]
MDFESYIAADDKQIVEWALEGDKAAFEVLVGRYRDAIHTLYTKRYGLPTEDADDLTQETFIKAFLKLKLFNAEYSFGQWIVTIARNNFIDFVRKRRDDTALDCEGALATKATSSPTPEERIISSQQKVQIEQYLQRMDPKYSRLIELRFIKELSYEEIAEELQIPLGTVKTQIHRARTRICEYIIEGGVL